MRGKAGFPRRPQGGPSRPVGRAIKAGGGRTSPRKRGPSRDGRGGMKRTGSSVLDRVSSPADMKHLSTRDLLRLCDEVRRETLSTVALTGGHLGASLGVVE